MANVCPISCAGTAHETPFDQPTAPLEDRVPTTVQPTMPLHTQDKQHGTHKVSQGAMRQQAGESKPQCACFQNVPRPWRPAIGVQVKDGGLIRILSAMPISEIREVLVVCLIPRVGSIRGRHIAVALARGGRQQIPQGAVRHGRARGGLDDAPHDQHTDHLNRERQDKDNKRRQERRTSFVRHALASSTRRLCVRVCAWYRQTCWCTFSICTSRCTRTGSRLLWHRS